MRQLLPILAIPVLLAGRPASLVHCHAGSERPHVHLGSIDHPAHCSDSPDSNLIERPASHDDDAVYISDDPATIAPAKTGVDAPLMVAIWPVGNPQTAAGSRDLHRHFHPPPIVSDSDCPRFIRQLSLLI